MENKLSFENEMRNLNQQSVDIINKTQAEDRDLTDEEQAKLDKIADNYKAAERQLYNLVQMFDTYEKIYNATYALNRIRNRLNESEFIYESAESEAFLSEVEMGIQYNIQSHLMPVLKNLIEICPDIKEKKIKLSKCNLLNYDFE